MKHLLIMLSCVTFASAASAQEIEYSQEVFGEAVEEVEQPIEEAAPVVPEGEDFTSGYRNVVILQGLNKVTARISAIESPVGVSAHFGNLEIIVKRCWQAPPTSRPENAALMEIIDRRPNEVPKEVFNGWMFSSSPSLAGLEHPVYDIVVLGCEDRKINPDE